MANDYVNYNELLTLVEEMFDEHSLTSESDVYDFSTPDMNFHELKSLVCNNILQLMLNVNNDKNLSELDKFVSLASSMSYLAAENFVLWYEIMKRNSDEIRR